MRYFLDENSPGTIYRATTENFSAWNLWFRLNGSSPREVTEPEAKDYFVNAQWCLRIMPAFDHEMVQELLEML